MVNAAKFCSTDSVLAAALAFFIPWRSRAAAFLLARGSRNHPIAP